MSEMKHSPIPWRHVTGLSPDCLSCESNGVIGSEVRDADDKVVFYDGHDTGMMGHEGDWPFIVIAVNSHAANQQLITRLTEALAEAIRCAGHVHTHDCPMRNYNTPCKCWVLPARAALAAVAKERA